IGCGSLRDGPLGKRKFPGAYHNDLPWVSDVWVHPDARGQSLARRIITALEDEARACGYDRLYISTTIPKNALYDRMGYTQVSTSILNGTPLRSLRKRL
ncbi:MAG: GNAT family N-acetyltransferase, partial [Pseudomonadota bacterium]